MRIREEQMAHFAALARRGFVPRVRGYLRENAGERVSTLPDARLDAHIEAVLDLAARHDVVMESDVATLVVLFAYLGWDAHERVPWVRATLADRGLDGAGKLRTLLRSYEATGGLQGAPPHPGEGVSHG